MASPIFLSNPPPGFSFIAILRGLQLAFLGVFRSLQNPQIFKHGYYKQLITAIKYSIMIQAVLWMPIVSLRIIALFTGFIFESLGIDDFATALKRFQFETLNISVFVISASRYFSKDLDNLFLESLKFIDSVSLAKHPNSKRRYYDNLIALSDDSTTRPIHLSIDSVRKKFFKSQDFAVFVKRHVFKALSNIAILLIGRIPTFGRLFLSIISFLNLNDRIGTVRAAVVATLLHFLPKRYSVLFLSTYWASRSMVRDLLLPYFTRVRFTKRENEQWIKSREGILFGFGFCYFLLLQKLPWVGLLIYGMAELSMAYLITKVSDPPPETVSQLLEWNLSQTIWNKEAEANIISGAFAEQDEGFKTLPGSFIFAI